MRTNRHIRMTVLLAVAFVLGAAAASVLLNKIRADFALSIEDSLALLKQPAEAITPAEALEKIKAEDKSILFLDLRHPTDFEQGHLPGAVNVPVRDLLGPEGRAVLQQAAQAGQKTVLYGDAGHVAGSAWLVLRQAGFQELRYLAGDFAQIQTNPSFALPGVESPAIDTNALKPAPPVEQIKPAAPAPPRAARKRVIMPVKRTDDSGEGC